MPAKPIDGILVIVIPAYSRGVKGPVFKWDMPVNAYSCGELIGYRVCEYSIRKQKIVCSGWSFDTEQEAMAHARKVRAQKRRRLKKIRKLFPILNHGENENGRHP